MPTLSRLSKHSNRSQNALVDSPAARNAAAALAGTGNGDAAANSIQGQQTQQQQQASSQTQSHPPRHSSRNPIQFRPLEHGQNPSEPPSLAPNAGFSSSESSFVDPRPAPPPLATQQQQQPAVGGNTSSSGAPLPPPHQPYGVSPDAASADSPVFDNRQHTEFVEGAVNRSQSQRYSTYAGAPSQQYLQHQQQYRHPQVHHTASSSLDDLPGSSGYPPQPLQQQQQQPAPEKKSKRGFIRGIFSGSNRSSNSQNQQQHQQPQIPSAYDNTQGLARRPSRRESGAPGINTRLPQQHQQQSSNQFPPDHDWSVPPGQGGYSVESSPLPDVGEIDEYRYQHPGAEEDSNYRTADARPPHSNNHTATIRPVTDEPKSPYQEGAYRPEVPHQQVQLQKQQQHSGGYQQGQQGAEQGPGPHQALSSQHQQQLDRESAPLPAPGTASAPAPSKEQLDLEIETHVGAGSSGWDHQQQQHLLHQQAHSQQHQQLLLNQQHQQLDQAHRQEQAQYPQAPPSSHQHHPSGPFSTNQPPQSPSAQTQSPYQQPGEPRSAAAQQQLPLPGPPAQQHLAQPQSQPQPLPHATPNSIFHHQLQLQHQNSQNSETVSQISHDSPVTDPDQRSTSRQSIEASSASNYAAQLQDVPTPNPPSASLVSLPPQQQQHQSSMAPPSGAPPSARDKAPSRGDIPTGPPPAYRHSNNSLGALSVPPGQPGSQNQAYRGENTPRFESPGMDQGRHSPQPASDAAEGEKAFKDLLTKYKNVKRLYFDGKSQIDNLTGQVEQLQNAVANQRITQSRTALDDSEYATRFNRLNGALNNLSFNIRKDWRSLPPWLASYVSPDALKTGKQEMTAVGRAVIARWLVEELFDKCFHPALDPLLSAQLKEIEQSIRGNAYTMVSQEEFSALTSKVVHWRMATLDGLQKTLNSPAAADNRQSLTSKATSNLTAYLYQFLNSPPPPGVEGSTSMIIELAIGIAANLPLESRDVAIQYPLPGDIVRPEIMEVEKTELPPLEMGADDDSDASEDEKDKNKGRGEKTKSAIPKDNTRVRFAGFPAWEVRGRQVLMKAPVWTV